MVHYRRNRQAGGTYFFTINLYDRNSNLLIENIDLLKEVIKKVHQNMPYKQEAFVVLPEHIHAIWTLPINDNNYPVRWRYIKTYFTQGLLQKNYPLKKNRKGEYFVWQKRYWEHTIKNTKDYVSHINYIHYNPVKHGLVTSPKDWPYSTFHQFVRERKLSESWGEVDNNHGYYGE